MWVARCLPISYGLRIHSESNLVDGNPAKGLTNGKNALVVRVGLA